MPNKSLTWAIAKAKDWKNYLPPTRPSTSELAVIEKYIIQQTKKNRHKKFKTAILGCTIEFRNLAHKYCMEVTCIDISDIHYRILSKQQMFYKGSEKLLIMDWRQMNCDTKYDLVLGDLVFNMLNTSDRNLLLKNVKAILAKDGIFISRSWIKIPSMPKNFGTAVQLARQKFPTLNFYTATAGYVYPAYIDSSEFADVKKLKQDLEKLRLTKEITPTEYKYWHDRLKYEIKGVSVPTMTTLNNQISKYFKVIDIKSGIDAFADLFKIYFLRRKN